MARKIACKNILVTYCDFIIIILCIRCWLNCGWKVANLPFFGVIALVQVSGGDGDDEEPVREEQIIGALKEHEAGMPTADL
ncbi:hypothetical protein L2449_03720 [Mesorhizobium muleiense]|uniref:hypothetical protein n=1 Tax=Mesorhizobium muleiense TaxID=1004279 RepID=UPI001F31F398|nr:hypothetical protein [Mesorhizobium muleiense]MCF6116031.1 hypothetical protein [Mesorhizobium muleiense]